MEISIIPKKINTTLTFDKCSIIAMMVTPFQGAKIIVQLHFIDSSSTVEDSLCTTRQTIDMSLNEYNNWISDEYLIDFVLAKLNLAKA